MRILASFAPSRWCLNAYYNSLSIEARSRYHKRYSTIFRGPGPLPDGTWQVRFLGKPVRLPLRAAHSWTDWANALAILGHDPEVKSAYERLLSSPQRPELFLDVGANFGTHSLLFAAQGVRTIAFEPNAKCRDYATAACALSGLDIQWEAVAIGDRDGEVQLVFPDEETWLGSIAGDVVSKLQSYSGTTISQTVPLRRLDHYAEVVRGKRALMKIDVEGSEDVVLAGAPALLSQSAPTIIFESNDPAKRSGLHALLARHGYVVSDLRYPGTGLDAAGFASCRATNFLAVSPAAA